MQTTDSGTRNINNRRIATAQLLRNAATEDDNDTSTSRRLHTSTSILQLDHLTLYNNDLDKYLDDSTATTSTATTTTTTSTTRQLCNNNLDNSTTKNNRQLPRQLYNNDLDNFANEQLFSTTLRTNNNLDNERTTSLDNNANEQQPRQRTDNRQQTTNTTTNSTTTTSTTRRQQPRQLDDNNLDNSTTTTSTARRQQPRQRTTNGHKQQTTDNQPFSFIHFRSRTCVHVRVHVVVRSSCCTLTCLLLVVWCTTWTMTCVRGFFCACQSSSAVLLLSSAVPRPKSRVPRHSGFFTLLACLPACLLAYSLLSVVPWRPQPAANVCARSALPILPMWWMHGVAWAFGLGFTYTAPVQLYLSYQPTRIHDRKAFATRHMFYATSISRALSQRCLSS